MASQRKVLKQRLQLKNDETPEEKGGIKQTRIFRISTLPKKLLKRYVLRGFGGKTYTFHTSLKSDKIEFDPK